jgi:HK97 gp10 family phage protein
MEDTIYVKGLSDLQKFMDTLAPKVERNVLRGSLRAGMKVVLPVAQQMAHKVSGQMADGLKLSTNARGGVVTASIKAKGPHGYLARWVEYGTAAHNIAAKQHGWLSFMNIFVKEVAHPGARPFPFMRPALDAQAQPAVIAAAEYMKNRLATKEGLDTADIAIGDEP